MQGETLKQYLMYGYEEGIIKYDLPDGAVRGVPASATKASDVKHVEIGARKFEETFKERAK